CRTSKVADSGLEWSASSDPASSAIRVWRSRPSLSTALALRRCGAVLAFSRCSPTRSSSSALLTCMVTTSLPLCRRLGEAPPSYLLLFMLLEAVEMALEDAAGPARDPPVVVVQLRCAAGRVAAPPGHGLHVAPGARQDIGGPAGAGHRGAADPRGQGPGAVEQLDVARLQEVELRQRGQGLARGGGPQPGVPGRVLELEELDEPFHVAEPTAPQLHTPRRIGTARQPLGLHPRLDAADLPDL